MAFFKFRKGGDESIAAPIQPESVEAMRRRARQRLIGAAVLVLAGVVGFPLLFDTQPRPIAVDIPIDIPDRNKVKPLTPPAAAAGPVTAAAEGAAPAAPTPAHAAASANAASPSSTARPPAASTPAPAAAAVATAKPEHKPVAPEEGARAKALLDGQGAASAASGGASAAAADGRFVVQVGAFSDAAKARDARVRLEKAGLKTYTHVADTKDGKRIRVRVGPFGTRGEADKAAQKIKGLDLPAAILTL